MHISILGEISKIKTRSKELGFDLDVSPTLDNDSVIFCNLASSRVIIMGMVEVLGQEVIAAYSIDPYMWRWAEKEGFTKGEIMSRKNLSSKVFTEISIDKVAEGLV